MAEQTVSYSDDSEWTEDTPGTSRQEIGQRIAVVCELVGTRRHSARVAGISEDQLSRYIRGKSEVSFSPLARLAKRAGVRLDWLWEGKGPMLAEVMVHEEPVTYRRESRSIDGYRVPPALGMSLPGAYGAGVNSPQLVDHVAFGRDWLRDAGLDPETMALVQVVGDSMRPTFGDGDLVLVDTGKRRLAEEGIYAVRQEQHLIVKRLQVMLSGELYIQSDNEAYSTQIIPRDAVDELPIVGRVAWVLRRL
jgi:phage repressor protein C with HTH and peptisase S24 domain